MQNIIFINVEGMKVCQKAGCTRRSRCKQTSKWGRGSSEACGLDTDWGYSQQNEDIEDILVELYAKMTRLRGYYSLSIPIDLVLLL